MLCGILFEIQARAPLLKGDRGNTRKKGVSNESQEDPSAHAELAGRRLGRRH